MSKKKLLRYQQHIERAIDRILVLLYISIVVSGLVLVLVVEDIVKLF